MFLINVNFSYNKGATSALFLGLLLCWLSLKNNQSEIIHILGWQILFLLTAVLHYAFLYNRCFKDIIKANLLLTTISKWNIYFLRKLKNTYFLCSWQVQFYNLSTYVSMDRLKLWQKWSSWILLNLHNFSFQSLTLLHTITYQDTWFFFAWLPLHSRFLLPIYHHFSAYR